MKVARLTFALVLVSLMAGLVLAQDTQQQPGRGRGRGRGGFGGGDAAGMFERLTTAVQKLDLTAEQKGKIEALKTEYGPKLKAIHEKAENILTAEQKTARDEAMKAARDATGDARRDAYRKVRDAVKLTDDQKKAMEPVTKEGRELMEKARPAVMAVLTDEQKTKLRESMPGRGGRSGGGSRGA